MATGTVVVGWLTGINGADCVITGLVGRTGFDMKPAGWLDGATPGVNCG